MMTSRAERRANRRRRRLNRVGNLRTSPNEGTKRPYCSTLPGSNVHVPPPSRPNLDLLNRAPHKRPCVAVSRPSVPTKAFKEGEAVEARYKNQWFKATVKQDNGDGTFAVDWENGYSAQRWKGMFIRRPTVALTSPSHTPRVSPPASPQLRAVAPVFKPRTSSPPRASTSKPEPVIATLTADNLDQYNRQQGLNPDVSAFKVKLNPNAPVWEPPSALKRAVSPPLVVCDAISA